MPLHEIYRYELPETTELREGIEDSFIDEAVRLETDNKLVKYEFAKALYHNKFGYIYNESYPKFIERLAKALKLTEE